MSLGTNIKRIREERKLTQEQIADMLDVSFQAVSSWERDEYKPDLDNLIKLANRLDVSLSSLVEDKKQVFETKKALYDWEHMKTYVKTTAKNLNLINTLNALEFAVKAHEGQLRKKSDIPYIYHPLNLACHALAMNIKEDEIIAACLLHDVVEDCNVKFEELPVNEETKELVRLLTHSKTNDGNRDELMKSYYDAIAKNPKASLIKCIDRCNNLTTMSWGLSKNRIFRMILETEKYFNPLLNTLKQTHKYNDAYWLLNYQIASMLDIYKRLL